VLGTKLQALLQQVVTPLAQKGLTEEQPSVDVHAITVVDCVCVVVTADVVAQLINANEIRTGVSIACFTNGSF
jgi:hypothetical protein